MISTIFPFHVICICLSLFDQLCVLLFSVIINVLWYHSNQMMQCTTSKWNIPSVLKVISRKIKTLLPFYNCRVNKSIYLWACAQEKASKEITIYISPYSPKCLSWEMYARQNLCLKNQSLTCHIGCINHCLVHIKYSVLKVFGARRFYFTQKYTHKKIQESYFFIDGSYLRK